MDLNVHQGACPATEARFLRLEARLDALQAKLDAKDASPPVHVEPDQEHAPTASQVAWLEMDEQLEPPVHDPLLLLLLLQLQLLESQLVWSVIAEQLV